MTDPAEEPMPASVSMEALVTRKHEVILVIDLVDSVRLMQADEVGTIERWLRFQESALAHTIPAHAGRVARSTGDGLLVVFASSLQAVQAALALHRLLDDGNRAHPGTEPMALRAGIHAAQVYTGAHDIYGDGVNLAARLMGLAGPSETMVSEAARESLSDGLDVALEDMGECFLKNVQGGVRVYRAGAAGPAPVLALQADAIAALEPTVAVIPFEARQADTDALAIGDLIADGLIAQLSRYRTLRIISRLSTRAFTGRPADADALQSHLGAHYVLTGSYGVLGGRILVHYELCDVRQQQVLEAGRVTGQVADLLAPQSEIVGKIIEEVSASIFRETLHHVQVRPLPTLESYALLLGAIQLLHRSTTEGFAHSYRVLDYLLQKHPRAIGPRLWLAKWHTLRAVQDANVDRTAYARAALSLTRRALDTEPTNAFALAMEGFVHCHLTLDYEAASVALRLSVENNRSETLGHLFHGLTQGLNGDYAAGIASFEEASAVSPLDPEAYMIDSVGASMYLGAHQHEQAIALAQRSLRRNRLHAHSWRALTIALAETDRLQEASQALQQVLALQPTLTAASYLAGARADDRTRRRFAQALMAAGLAPG